MCYINFTYPYKYGNATTNLKKMIYLTTYIMGKEIANTPSIDFIFLIIFMSVFILFPCIYLKICMRFLKGEGDYPFFSWFVFLAEDEKTKREMKEQEARWGLVFLPFFIFIVSLIFFFVLYTTLLDYGYNKIISIVFALLLPISYLTIIVRYFHNYWKREERKKFTVGEKYIVPYSNIDELKEEVKGWLNDNKMNIIKEDHGIIEAVKTRVDIGYYDLSIIIKFIPNISKTIIIFDKNLARNYPIINFGIKKVLLELRRNLIRKLNGREEIKINLTRFFVIDYIFLFVVFLSLGYLVFNKYVVMERLSIIWGSIAISYPLVRRLWFSYKVEKQASLPEYYIEEYSGDVYI